MRTHKGFTLIEAMVALGISSIVIVSAMATFRIGLSKQSNQNYDWFAFTLAQQHLELLSAVDASSPDLSDNSGDAVAPAEFGRQADATCATGVDQLNYYDRAGNRAAAADKFVVCYKITDDATTNMKYVRVVVGYAPDEPTITDLSDLNYTILQVLRPGDAP